MNPLTHFPRHPSAPDTYYINGAWAPAAITAVEKRFTDAELAAEYWKYTFRYSEANGAKLTELMEERMNTIYRMITNSAHDEDPS